MAGITYEVHVGSQKATNAARDGDLVLLSLSTELTMDGAGGRCALQIAVSGAEPPKPGDAVTVTLGNEGVSGPVFDGEVQRVAATPTTLRILATDGLSKLAGLEVEAVYEKTSAGKIAKELIEGASLTAGTVDDGPKLPSYVLFRGPTALRHLQRLAEQSGCDLYTDGEGKVHFAKPKSGGADHVFEYGKHVLDFVLEAVAPAYDSVVVWGEGAGSTKGEDKNHWLVGDLGSVSGKASLDASFTVKPGSAGVAPRTIQDGAVRAGADAADQAEARVTALASRPVRGALDVLGSPKVQPGDLVKLDRLPAAHAAAAIAAGRALRVRRVRHVLSASKGLVTRMEF